MSKKLRQLLLAVALCPAALPAHGFELNFNDIGTALEIGEAVVKGVQDITPEQEYYLGRAVAARLLERYPLQRQSRRDRYLNEIGTYLARFSTQPETFGGYRFAVVDSNEVNAFAAPGGLILITRALYRTAENEDQLAAVLAHEIAHVALRHGMNAIQQSNLTQAGVLIGKEYARREGAGDLARVDELVGLFGTSVEDVVHTMAVSGYSQGQEFDADRAALEMLYRSGYNPEALAGFLRNLAAKTGAMATQGFGATHPAASARLTRVEQAIETTGLAGETSARREARYRQRSGT